MPEYPVFSIIIPVKNAASEIPECLGAIRRLDYPPDKIEVILADGCSQDDTRRIAEALGAKVIPNPKQIVGSGRNIGFFNSRGARIVFTDADCILPADYLKNSLRYFDDESVAGLSGPVITPPQSSSFEKAVKFIYELATLISGSVHREKVKGPHFVGDIPGCNSIYRRQALEKVMPIDEGLLTAEDVDLNFRIRRAGYKLICVPDVCVWHYRRSSFAGFFRQLYRFAVGRLQAGKKDIRMINPTHILAGLSLPILTALFVLAILYPGVFYVCIGSLGAGMLLLFLLALARSGSLAVAFNAVLAAGIAAASWSLGFLRELFFPLKELRGR